VGAGTMGVGILHVFAVAGADTYVVEPDKQRAAGVPGVLSGAAEDGIKRGKLGAAEALAALERVHVVGSVAQLPADLHSLVESMPENFSI
jgi:3-hydroxybutyryl-CoA dehydrogenase